MNFEAPDRHPLTKARAYLIVSAIALTLVIAAGWSTISTGLAAGDLIDTFYEPGLARHEAHSRLASHMSWAWTLTLGLGGLLTWSTVVWFSRWRRARAAFQSQEQAFLSYLKS